MGRRGRRRGGGGGEVVAVRVVAERAEARVEEVKAEVGWAVARAVAMEGVEGRGGMEGG